MSEVATPEVIKRSVCLFQEYHGLYEDDYEGVFYWDPETGLFGSDYWTTAGACNYYCPKVEDFAWKPYQVYKDEIPQEYKDRILADLREHILHRKASWVKNAREYYGQKYNKYSYQHESFEEFMKEFEANFEGVVRSIDCIAWFLNYVSECTTYSYKNDKDSIKWAVNGKSLMELVAKSCKHQLMPKKKRQVSTENMTRFEGKVISVKYDQSTYGLRSDWHEICKVGISQGEGKKSVWFNAPKEYAPEKGQTVEVFSKDFTEYEKSIQVRRPVVNVL